MGIKINSDFWNDRRASNRPTWVKILLPLVLALLATWITLHPLVLISYRTPFLLYFGIIFISAGYGGSLSSLTAACSSAVLCLIFILPKHADDKSFFIGATCIFLTESLLLSTVFRAVEVARNKLVHSEERFRSVIEKSLEGFIVSLVNGHVLYVSPSVTNLLGYHQDALLDTKLQAIIHPEEQPAFESLLASVNQKEGSSATFLHRISNKDNEWQWIEGTVTTQSDYRTNRSLVFQYRNVNSRINKEQQREDFIHVASHELKTPVTALKGYVQLQIEQLRSAGYHDEVKISERMEAQANRIIHLIDDMLDTARISTGEMTYNFELFDMVRCVQEVLAAFQVAESNHVFEFAGQGTAFAYGDAERICQVISNLIGNAVKYSPGKNIITIAVSKEGRFVRVSVRDEGIGISKPQQKKIFERFYRSATLHKQHFKGLGLGLYISAEIVKAHKGKIGVDSDPGRGSTFWFTICDHELQADPGAGTHLAAI